MNDIEITDFDFISPKESMNNFSASVQKTGRLGFSLGAIKRMNLSKEKFIRIARNSKNKGDTNFYVFVTEKKEEDSFPIVGAGKYVYVNVAKTFKDLGIDYKSQKIKYLISEINKGGISFFEFKLIGGK
jgi:hypothetical protein